MMGALFGRSAALRIRLNLTNTNSKSRCVEVAGSALSNPTIRGSDPKGPIRKDSCATGANICVEAGVHGPEPFWADRLGTSHIGLHASAPTRCAASRRNLQHTYHNVSNSKQTWSNSGKHSSNPIELGAQIRLNMWPTCAQHLANTGRTRANNGKHVAKFGPEVTEFGPTRPKLIATELACRFLRESP